MSDPESGPTSDNNKIQSSPLLRTLPTSSTSSSTLSSSSSSPTTDQPYLFSATPQEVQLVSSTSTAQRGKLVQKLELVQQSEKEKDEKVQDVCKQFPLEPTLLSTQQLLENNEVFFQPRLTKIARSIKPTLVIESQITISDLILQYYATPSQLFTELCQKQFFISTEYNSNREYKFNMIQIIQLIPKIYPYTSFGDTIDLFTSITSTMVKMDPNIQLSGLKEIFEVDTELFKHLISVSVKRIISDFDEKKYKAIAETTYLHYTDPELLLSQFSNEHNIPGVKLKPLFKKIYPIQNESIKKAVDDATKHLIEPPTLKHDVESIVDDVENFNQEVDQVSQAFVKVIKNKLYPMDAIILQAEDFHNFSNDEPGQLEFFTNLFDFKSSDELVDDDPNQPSDELVDDDQNQSLNELVDDDQNQSLNELVDVVFRPSSIVKYVWFGRGPNIKSDDDKSYNLAPQKYQFITPQSAFIYTAIYTLIQIFAAIKLEQFTIPNLIQKQSNEDKNGATKTQTFTNVKDYINDIPEAQIAHVKLLILMSGSLSPQQKQRRFHHEILTTGSFTSNYEFVESFQNQLFFSIVGPAGFGKTEILNTVQMLCFRHKIPLITLDSSAKEYDFVNLHTFNRSSITRARYCFGTKKDSNIDPTPSTDSISFINSHGFPTSVLLFDPRESQAANAFHLQGVFLKRDIFNNTQNNQGKLFFSMHSQPIPDQLNAQTDKFIDDKTDSNSSIRIKPYPPFMYLHFINNNYHQMLQLLFSKLFNLLEQNQDQDNESLQHIKTVLFPFTSTMCNASIRGYLQFLQEKRDIFIEAFFTSEITQSRANQHSKYFYEIYHTNTDSQKLITRYIVANTSHFSPLYNEHGHSSSQFLQSILSLPTSFKFDDITREKVFYSSICGYKRIPFKTSKVSRNEKIPNVDVYRTIALIPNHNENYLNIDDKNLHPFVLSSAQHIKHYSCQKTTPVEVINAMIKHLKNSLDSFPDNSAMVYICPPNYAAFDNFTIYRQSYDSFFLSGGQFSVSSVSVHSINSGVPIKQLQTPGGNTKKQNENNPQDDEKDLKCKSFATYSDVLQVQVEQSTELSPDVDVQQPNNKFCFNQGRYNFNISLTTCTYFHQYPSSKMDPIPSYTYDSNKDVNVCKFIHPNALFHMDPHHLPSHPLLLQLEAYNGSTINLVDILNGSLVTFKLPTKKDAMNGEQCSVSVMSHGDPDKSELLRSYEKILCISIYQHFQLIADTHFGQTKVFTIQMVQNQCKISPADKNSSFTSVGWDWSEALKCFTVSTGTNVNKKKKVSIGTNVNNSLKQKV